MVNRHIIFWCFILFSLPWRVSAESDSTQLSVWANEAIVATYTYNSKNFLVRQKAIATYFTAAGWIAYSKALQDSKLPEMIQKNQYDVSAVATSPPVVSVVGLGQLKAVMPLLVVYKNPQYQQKQYLDVTLLFTTVPAKQGVRGLAITSMKTAVVTPLCQCPIQ